MARRAGRGEEAAFAELYERHAPGLLSFVQQYVGDRAAAEDVVQLTFLAAFRTLSGGTTLEHPRAWLYHVARNNALNVVRDRRPAALERSLEEDLLDRAAAVPAQIEQREALEEVVRDIVALPAQQRAALALFEVADLSQAEIAEVLDCTPAQVKALVYQARSALVGRREARSASCTSVRERLAAARGGGFNQRVIRHHLRHCEPCTAFRDELRDRRRRVALLLPILPAPGLRDAVLGGFGTHGHAAAGAAGLARPGRARWIAGGATATAAALGVAWLAWPGAPQPHVQPPPPAAAPSPAVTTPRATVSRPTAHASRPSRSPRRPPHAARTAVARQATAVVRDAGAPVATPRPAEPAPTPRSRVRTPAPETPAPPAPRAGPPPPVPTPSPPPIATPSPAAAAAPAVTPPPAAPVPVPVPPESAPPCTDHSRASEQGLEHGKGHHKC